MLLGVSPYIKLLKNPPALAMGSVKELRDKYPEEFKKIRHHELFTDFTGSGFYLVQHATPNLIAKARWLAGK